MTQINAVIFMEKTNCDISEVFINHKLLVCYLIYSILRYHIAINITSHMV